MHILTLPFAFKIFLKNMLRAVELAQQLVVPARGVSQTFNYSSKGSSALDTKDSRAVHRHACRQKTRT